MDKTVSNKKVDKTGTPISGTLSLKLPMKILFKKKIEFQIMSSESYELQTTSSSY